MDKKPFRTTRLIASLRQGRNDWYRITNSAGPQAAQLHIYDEIGYFGVTAADMIRDLAAVDGDLEVHLNTPGGEVFDGIAIHNALSQRDGTVRVIVDSLAASIGSVIAMAASPGELVMAKNATMMIHDGFGVCIGNEADMTEMAALLAKTSDNIASIYAERTGQPAETWRQAMRAETWYSAQEAVGAGLADAVQGGKGKPGNTWDLSVFAGAPGTAPKLTDAADESAWDASRAWSAGAASDDPAAFYDGICAGKKAGDPATQAAHALPHHYHPGDPPNRHGVSAALGRLPGTDGLTNEAAARSHLEAHQSAMGSGSSDNLYSPLDSGDLAALQEVLAL